MVIYLSEQEKQTVLKFLNTAKTMKEKYCFNEHLYKELDFTSGCFIARVDKNQLIITLYKTNTNLGDIAFINFELMRRVALICFILGDFNSRAKIASELTENIGKTTTFNQFKEDCQTFTGLVACFLNIIIFLNNPF